KAGEVGEAIKMGDLTGLHDTWVDLNARMAEWWTSHVIEWGNLVEEADVLVGEGQADAANALYRARLETAKAEANRIMEMQTAAIDGLVKGLNESGVEVGPKYALGMRTQIAEWKKFFEVRDSLWEGYGDARNDGTLETGRYVEIIDELAIRYDRLAADEMDLQQIMDAEIVSATADVNLRAATVLSSLLDTIREHQAKIFTQEAAVRTAAHELWNLTTGAEAANVLMRNFAGHPELAKAFDTLVKRWKQRTTEVTPRDLRSFRRQVYDVWSRDVKVEHIKDYYLLRSEGMLEVMSEDANVRPPDVERPEPVRATTESTGSEAEVARAVELVEGGTPPEEATRIASEQIAGETMDVDYSKATTIEELRMRANDAGIATATRDGKPFDGHLLNVLNKDLGLNDSPMKLRRLGDLVDIQREGGGPTDAMDAARQALVNRGAKRLQWRQESRIVNLSIEALTTLDDGIDNVGTKKLRRIAEANGLTEANLMPKEALWSWMDSRRNRLRPVPFEAATPEALKLQIKEAMDRTGYPGSEIADATLATLEARAKAIGMTVGEYIEFRYGLDNPDIIYTFSQMEGRPESPWIQRARQIFDIRSDIKQVETGWLLTNGDIVEMLEAHAEIGRVWGEGETSVASVEKFLETGAVRYGLYGGPIPGKPGIVAIEFKSLPSAMQRVKLSTLMEGNKGYVVEFRSLSGKDIQTLVNQDFPTRSQIQGMWRQMIQAAEQHTTTFFQDADAHRPFYSQMIRVIDAKMPERMPVGDFLNFLKNNGVKADELKWSGIEEYARGLEGGIDQPSGVFAGPEPVIEKSTALAVARDLTPLVKETLYPVEPTPIQRADTSWRTEIPREQWMGADVGHPNLDARPRALWAGGFDSRVVDVAAVRFVDNPGAGATYVVHEFIGGPPEAPYPDIMGTGRFLLEQRSTGDVVRADPDPLTGAPDVGKARQMMFDTLENAKAYAEAIPYETTTQRAQWENVTYPGGTNYREVVLHLPPRAETVRGLTDKINGVFRVEVSGEGKIADPPGDPVAVLGLELIRRNYTGDEFPGVQQAVAELDAYARMLGYDPASITGDFETYAANIDYQSPHFSEVNTIAFPRLKDRFTADGRRILFIEELQSDWGQLWREQSGRLNVEANRQPPPMPWQKTWHEYAMRRIMHMAAEEGYDGVAWNTGEGMFRTETGDFAGEGAVDFQSIEWNVSDIEEVGSLTIIRPDELGEPQVARHENITAAAAETILGHDAFMQLVNNGERYAFDDATGTHHYELGSDDIEGNRYNRMLKGFKGFYDEILPSFMKKEVKKWGAQVEDFEFGSGVTLDETNVRGLRDPVTGQPRLTPEQLKQLEDTTYSPGHVVYITDEMRAGTGPEFKLFQEANEFTLRDNELTARRALLEVIRQEELPTQPFYEMVGEGKPLADVLGKEWAGLDVPKSVLDAHIVWEETLRAGQWLDGQRNMTAEPKGAVAIGRDGRALMRFFNNADPSTAIHEVGHIFRLDLQPSELGVVTDWLRNTVRKHDGVDVSKVEVFEGRFTGDEGVPRAAEEAFARGFERYVSEGIAPTEALRSVFEKFRQWLLGIYQQIKGSGIDIPLNESMRALFSDMMGGRAPDFDIYNTTWKSIETDSVIRGQPEVAGIPPLATPVLDVPPSTRVGGVEGGITSAHGADPNVSYDFRYRIMDISEITPSHTLEGKLSEGYPKKLQPRDRSRAASVRQSQQIAAELNPVTLLEPNVRIDEGSPIIGPDGLVESGSGRINALVLAMEQHPEGYAAYKQLLLDYVREGTYGDIDVAQIPDNPVLIRERLTEMDRFEFARVANESAILGTSAAEQALIDTGKVSDQMLADLVISEGQTAQDALKAQANQGVVREFVNQSPRSEHAMLMTSDGQITRQGMDRLLAAIFMYVYGDETGSLRLAETVFESTDPVIRNITNGMMGAAGDMAKAEALIRSGRRPPELSLMRDLAPAVETLEGLKRRGIPLEDFTEQRSFEEMGVALSEFQTEILIDLELGKRSAKAIRDQLQTYARMVIQEPDTGQMGLLGAHKYPTAQELWVRAKESPASTAELFQLPEQYKMRGHFDQTPGIKENASKSSEGLRNMLGILDEVREQMTGPEGFLQEIRSEDVRGRLAPDQQAEFQKWTKDLKGQLTGTKFSGMKWGEETRNFSMLDYTALRGIDLGFLGPVANYSFWPTRTLMRWALRFMEYPALLANYARLNEARRKQEERPGFPRRLQGKVYMPLPWMPEWMGGGLWIDPIRQFFPPHMFLDNLDRVATAANREHKRATYILQKWVENGDTHPRDAQEAIQTKTGPLWQMAIDQANSEMEQEFKDPLDYMNIVTSLSLPLSIGHEIARGTPERIQPVPLTRYTKTATSMFSQMTGIGPPEGINLEGPIREFFDLPNYDRFEDYRNERMLASMAADDPSITRDALIAGIEKEGPLHDESIRRVNSARNFGIYANPAFWVFGLGGDTFPTGEVRQRKLGEEFGLAITAREVGDSTAINRFFEKYPEYETRLASFDSPEERMRFFLVDEVWVRYRELGSANKELARNQLGQDFYDLFLNKETRSYADIPLEHLASWAHLLGGYVPENAENRIEYKELAPPLNQLPPEYADIIDTFREQRNVKFPNWFAVQNRYFAAGPAKSQARKDYLAEWPELEAYWDWREDQLEGNEFLKSYYRRYDLENYEAGSLGSLGVAEILTNPILVRQLMADRYGGQSLTTGALAELRRIYELLQSPGGDFKEWIDGLEFEQGIEQQGQPGAGGLGLP
ncbi:hypothetical protein LCGC14_0962280, partial [marine sediment metagenome]